MMHALPEFKRQVNDANGVKFMSKCVAKTKSSPSKMMPYFVGEKIVHIIDSVPKILDPFSRFGWLPPMKGG